MKRLLETERGQKAFQIALTNTLRSRESKQISMSHNVDWITSLIGQEFAAPAEKVLRAAAAEAGITVID